MLDFIMFLVMYLFLFINLLQINFKFVGFLLIFIIGRTIDNLSIRWFCYSMASICLYSIICLKHLFLDNNIFFVHLCLLDFWSYPSDLVLSSTNNEITWLFIKILRTSGLLILMIPSSCNLHRHNHWNQVKQVCWFVLHNSFPYHNHEILSNYEVLEMCFV